MNWRCVVDSGLGGQVNMARDEALFTLFCENGGDPVFRLYNWSPASISLGRFQESSFLNKEYIKSAGIEVVRRFTGGKAIYHAADISYSIVCSLDDEIDSTYIKLTSFLFNLYSSLGLQPAYACDEKEALSIHNSSALCFAGRERRDIVVNGKKIGGNAQRRTRQAVIQHGSIPLSFNRSVLWRISCGTQQLYDNAASLEDFGIHTNYNEMTELMKAAFEKSYGKLYESKMTFDEQKLAYALLKDKYSKSEIIYSRKAMACAVGM